MKPRKTKWDDLPRRLLTIMIGFPLVLSVLAYPMTRKLFFVGVHFLCTREWISLVPSSSTSNEKLEQQKSRGTGGVQAQEGGDGERYQYGPVLSWIFSIFSIGLSLVPFVTLFFFLLLLLVAVLYLHSFILDTKIRIVPKYLQPQQPPHDTNDENEKKKNLNSPPQYSNHQNVFMHILFGFFFLTIPFFHWMQLLSVSTYPLSPTCSVNIIENPPTDNEECWNAMIFEHVLYLLLIVWNCDTGALVMGRILGGHGSTNTSPLQTKSSFYPRKENVMVPSQANQSWLSLNSTILSWIQIISPSKTGMGFMGGIFMGTITAVYFPLVSPYMVLIQPFLISMYPNTWTRSLASTTTTTTTSTQPWFLVSHLLQHPNLKHYPQRVFFGFLISVCAILGDLVESAIKRKSNKKDTGRFLPGHGGILDRFDSTLLSIVLYVFWISHVQSSDTKGGHCI